jgi:hypothetical protein
VSLQEAVTGPPLRDRHRQGRCAEVEGAGRDVARQQADGVVAPRGGVEFDEARGGGERRLGAVALPRALHCDIDQVHRIARQVRQVERGLDGELALPDRQGGHPGERRRRALQQPVEPERLELDGAVQPDDADLREGHCVTEPHRHAARRPWSRHRSTTSTARSRAWW